MIAVKRNNQDWIYYDRDGYGRLTEVRGGGLSRLYTYDACPADSPTPNCAYAAGRLTKVDHAQPQGTVRFQEFFNYYRPGGVEKKALRYLRSDTVVNGVQYGAAG